MSDKLRSLSDEDLNKLYNDAKVGIRKGNYRPDPDGFHDEGYSQLDFYTNQIMSSDFQRHERGEDEDKIMELSKLYRENVFDDYEGGHVFETEIREGLGKIYDEKERRRIKYIDDGRYKPPAEEAKDKEPQELGPEVISPQLQEARDRVQAYESNKGADSSKGSTVYGTNNSSTGTTNKYNTFEPEADQVETQQSKPEVQSPEEQAEGAQSFLDKYKLDLKGGRKIGVQNPNDKDGFWG